MATIKCKFSKKKFNSSEAVSGIKLKLGVTFARRCFRDVDARDLNICITQRRTIRIFHGTLTKYTTTSDNRSDFIQTGSHSIFHLNLYTKINCCCYAHTNVSSAKIFCMDFTAENKIFTTCMAGS